MDEEQVGKNRNLMKDFIALANKNKYSSASICFLISLNQFGESNLAFQLKLLKRLKDIPTPDFSTPGFNLGLFNPRLFNHELFNPRPRVSYNYLDWAKYQNRHSSKSV